MFKARNVFPVISGHEFPPEMFNAEFLEFDTALSWNDRDSEGNYTPIPPESPALTLPTDRYGIFYCDPPTAARRTNTYSVELGSEISFNRISVDYRKENTAGGPSLHSISQAYSGRIIRIAPGSRVALTRTVGGAFRYIGTTEYLPVEIYLKIGGDDTLDSGVKHHLFTVTLSSLGSGVSYSVRWSASMLFSFKVKDN